MSPILVRPVREQLEHDRVIRLLQAKLKRKFEVAANLGSDTTAPLRVGKLMVFPDLVLTTRGAKPAGVVEVETVESVNHLEALAQWAHFARTKVPFALYVPAASVDMARRLCAANHVVLDELWSYHAVGTQIRFTLVSRAPGARFGSAASRSRSASARRAKPSARAGTGATRRKKAPARSRAGSKGRTKPPASKRVLASKKSKTNKKKKKATTARSGRSQRRK